MSAQCFLSKVWKVETSYKEEYYAYYNKVNFNQILAFIVLLSYVVLNFFGEGWGDTPVP